MAARGIAKKEYGQVFERLSAFPSAARGLRSAGAGAALALALVCGAVPAGSAHAQVSEGYKFLEAVRKKDGNEVTEILSDPAQTIINTRDTTSGVGALHIIAQQRDATWLRFLISKGANVNARDDHGVSPLHIATRLNWRDGVEILLASAAQANVPDDAGETPLIIATHRRDTEVMKLLLESGANPDRADNSGRSARDYAMLEGERSGPMQMIEAYTTDAAKTGGGPVYGPSF